ncbi:MAG: hypothetical protein AB1644_10635 [Candidatus Zixiibacteriota bacterium]
MAMMRKRKPPKTKISIPARILLQTLSQIRYHFDPANALTRRHLLVQLRTLPIRNSAILREYHDLLSFHRAYPDDVSVLNLVEQQLQSFERRVNRLLRANENAVDELEDSGIAGTVVSHPYSYDLARSLTQWYPGKLEIDWNYYDEDKSGAIAGMLPLLVSWQENDTLDNDFTLDARDWLKITGHGKRLTELELLLKLLATSGLPRPVQRHLFESPEMAIRWPLAHSSASRTLRRVPVKRLFFQQTSPLGRCADLRVELARPIAPLKLLTRREGDYYVRAINEVLAVRVRELFSITGANPSEVYRYEPGRGVQIFLFGTNPDIRLPLEANFGAMLVRNGLPIGYGVGAVLFDRVEIAINIFPAFRAGESAFVIQEFFRVFHHHFGSNVLLVRSRQMGDGDDEPIKSGAFWFYYKLGFRAVRKQIRALADKENERLKANPGSRSSERTLRRLAKSDVFFHIDHARMGGYRELSLVNLGKVVTRIARDKYDNDRMLADTECATEVIRSLEIKGFDRWSRDEMVSLIRLAPLLSAIPDLRRWSRVEKQGLVKIIRARGGSQERQFVLLCNQHPRLYGSLRKLADNYRA